MLQWMGGSRRKVTTSRMSTQKRQKQYFEQKKRQQQDSYSDKPNVPSQHQNHNRSLDILGLLNIPPVDQEDNSSCPNVRNLEGELLKNGTTYSYQNSPRSPALQKNQVTAVGPVDSDLIKFTEPRNLSGYKLETVYPKKSSVSCSDINNRRSSEDGGNIDQMKFSKHHQLSVLDMLGDDGPNCNIEGNSGHESHVAFSLEGLGKVETETPVHSPQPTGRTISYNHTSPLKLTKQAHFSKDLSSRLDELVTNEDDMIRDHDIAFPRNSSDRPYYSMDSMDSYGKNPKQKTSSVENFLQFDDSDFNMKNAFRNEEVYYNRQCKTEHMRNDTNFLDEDESGLSWKNWNWEKDSISANYFNTKNHDNLDFNFESPCLQKKRVFAKATNRFSLSFSDLDSPLPYSKYQVSENDHDFLTQNEKCHTISRRDDFSNVMNLPLWRSSQKEEEKDSWSLLSEESCSSAAVRDQATEKESFESIGVQKKTYNHKPTAQLPNYFRQEYTPSDTSKKILDLDENFLFDERFKTKNTIHSDFDSFKENSPPSYRARTKKPFTDDPKYFLDTNLHSVGSNSKTESQHWEPYHVAFMERSEFSDILVRKGVSRDRGNTSQTLAPSAADVESKEDACNPSNGSENSCSHIKEVFRTPEKKEIAKTVCYPERNEDTSSSVEIPDNSVHEKEIQNASQESFPCQPGFNEVEEYRANKNNVNEDKATIKKKGEETCQVMMLESYVLQLLCMQKVPKETSTE